MGLILMMTSVDHVLKMRVVKRAHGRLKQRNPFPELFKIMLQSLTSHKGLWVFLVLFSFLNKNAAHNWQTGIFLLMGWGNIKWEERPLFLWTDDVATSNPN